MLIYILLCSLVIGEFDKSVATNISNGKKTSNGEELLSIQTKLLEIQNDIISITAAMGLVEKLDSIISKAAVIEDSFNLIKNELVDVRKQSDFCSEIPKALLNNQYDAVSEQLKNLQSSLKEYKQKRIPSQAIEDIRGFNFKSAEEKLKQINSFSYVLRVFESVYANNSCNFDLLANFTESLTNKDLVYNSAKALKHILSINGLNDPFKWIRLAKILEAGVIYQYTGTPSIKADAQVMVNELYQSIRFLTLEALNSTVTKGAFERNGEIENLTSAVYLFDPSESESIIEEFVTTTFDLESTRNILDTISSHRYIQQKVKGISALFWKINDSYDENLDVTIKIASTLYDIHSDHEFENLSRDMRISVKKIIENLPTCARNLFFQPFVCLWNRAKEEYLIAGNSSLNYDKSRRNIFLLEDPVPASHWYVKPIGDNFLFSSRTYPNEYLYAADFNFNADWRYVFNWVPGNNTDKQSEWTIRLNGDYCYIQTAAYGEYLSSSNFKNLGDDDLSSVFTWVPGISKENNELQWQIRKCD